MAKPSVNQRCLALLYPNRYMLTTALTGSGNLNSMIPVAMLFGYALLPPFNLILFQVATLAVPVSSFFFKQWLR
jgi:hypothetical protein